MSDRLGVTDAARLPTSVDLSEGAIEDAIASLTMDGKLNGPFKPSVLLVSKRLAFEAGRIAEKFDLGAIVLPDELMADTEAWGLANKYQLIWSNGA